MSQSPVHININKNSFSVKDTLESGQFFRYRKSDDGYEVIALNKRLLVRQNEHEVVFEGITNKDWNKEFSHFFALDCDYDKIKSILTNDPILKKAIDFAPGIRIMRQPFWETVLCFIISQNNNIPRISGIINRLCEEFGNNMGSFFTFPNPQRLAGLEKNDLKILRCGFRDKYIIDAANKFSDKTIDEATIYSLPYPEAKQYLMQINGVGPKIADCALLFGAGKLEAFPEDVWIKRSMSILFPNGLPDFAIPYAGIAQQYIYHYSRINKIH